MSAISQAKATVLSLLGLQGREQARRRLLEARAMAERSAAHLASVSARVIIENTGIEPDWFDREPERIGEAVSGVVRRVWEREQGIER